LRKRLASRLTVAENRDTMLIMAPEKELEQIVKDGIARLENELIGRSRNGDYPAHNLIIKIAQAEDGGALPATATELEHIAKNHIDVLGHAVTKASGDSGYPALKLIIKIAQKIVGIRGDQRKRYIRNFPGGPIRRDSSGHTPKPSGPNRKTS
jgi:hypothetical protein